jgi:carbon storage regulator
MLVLSRKCGEAIVIAENIKVTVLEVKGGRARLGFDAPDDAPIHRSEVHEKISPAARRRLCRDVPGLE